MTEHRAFEGDPGTLPLDALCAHVAAGTHARACAAVPGLRARLAALAAADPAGPARGLDEAFASIADLLLTHVAKEENILFPALVALAEAERSGRSRPPLPFPTVLHPIRVLEGEHARLSAAVAALEPLVHRAGDLTAGHDTWRDVLADLRAFLAECRAHVALEAGMLFPRALELDRRL